MIKEPVETIWDVVIMGGGPAGLMAAGRAAERGRKVIVLEKNSALGKKLLITGGGRCNLTNAIFDNRQLLEKFKDSGKYLFSAFSQWSVKETLDFFHSFNVETKVENENRVFPISDKAQTILNALVENISKHKVTVLSDSEVDNFEFDAETKTVKAVRLKNGQIIRAKSFILATGGKSHPETGSTGDGFRWLHRLGHNVVEPRPSLVPLRTNESWIKELQGITLQDIKVSLYENETKKYSKNGKVLFTHFGLTGPTILNMSKDVSEILKYGEATISLDLLPKMDYSALNFRLQELFMEHNKKKLKNSLGELIPAAIVPIVLTKSKVDPESWSHSITREERIVLIQVLKDIRISINGLLGAEKAIITSGGISLNEVDFKTMRSRIYSNLYLAGDILDIDRPSGGFSLQICWTTGFVAGNNT